MSRTVVALVAVPLFALAGLILAFPAVVGDPHRNDFTAYWAAGRLMLEGKNAYGAADLLALEQTIGWEAEAPLMLWNPPYMLSLLMLSGAVDFTLARGIWLLLQLGITLGCAIALWRFYGGSRRYEAAAVLLALFFAPLAISMRYGQIGPLCLLGLTGFLLLQSRQRDVLAGVALSLAAMKPHLVALVWPAVGVWSLARGRWRVLLGLGLAVSALAVVPQLVNHHVYADYLAMIHEPPPPELARLFITNQESPTFGWQLRLLIQKDWFRLQYVPTEAGMIWLVSYGYRHRRDWNWADRLPMLLLVSIITAAYGAWPADSLLLLPAVVAVAVHVGERCVRSEVRVALAVFVALSLLTHFIELGPSTQAYVWIPPMYLAAYVYFRR